MLSRRNFQLFSTWTLYVLLVCYSVSMEIEIKTFSTWCNEHFVLYMNGNYAGSFDSHAEATAYGLKLFASIPLLENK